MWDEVDDLARDVDRAWSATGRDRAAFGAIATEQLARPLTLDFDRLTRELVATRRPLPRQRRLDTGFGQPAITLHHDDRFSIEVLCWAVGTPGIHQHAFNGAFRLLTGRSLHTTYRFDATSTVDGLVLGDLRLTGWELLDSGQTRTIEEGDVFIHAAFHLDAPSTTIVVRTHDSAIPEYSYLPPGVAFDPAARDEGLHKRLQLLDTLDQVRSGLHLDAVRRMVAGGDLYQAVQAVLRASRHRLDRAGFDALVDHLVAHHGTPGEQCRPALQEAWRRDRLTALRAERTDPEHRFLLGCMLNLPAAEPVVEAMARYHGGDEQAARHAIATAATRLLGLDPRADDLVSTAVEAMLDGLHPAAFADLAATRWPGPPPPDRAELMAFYADLQSQPLLTPLLTPRTNQDRSAGRRDGVSW